MSTSDINPSPLKTAVAYITASALCAAFGMVYEFFSHGVYSYYMLYFFMLPLVFGALPFGALALLGRLRIPRLPFNLYNSGLAAFTAGCCFKGVLEIYGTSSPLTAVYWAAGFLLLIASAAALIINYSAGKRRKF